MTGDSTPSTPPSHSDPPMRLLPASRFSLEELTIAYNLARADYLVPMQTDDAHLAEYMRIYDVDLEHSWVVVQGAALLGLAMLGARQGRTWVTRLGVLPSTRRGGTGAALVSALLESTRRLGHSVAILEVIQGNMAAKALFEKLGFRETRALLVKHRPPGDQLVQPKGRAEWLGQGEALDLIRAYPTRLPWTNEAETFINAGDGAGLRVDLPGDRGQRRSGWIVFRRYGSTLSHFIFHTEEGQPALVGAALLAHLYARYPRFESHVENIPADDPHHSALDEAGFIEEFRRTEMVWSDSHPLTPQTLSPRGLQTGP